MPSLLTVHWFRRDLRLHDNAALYHALNSGMPVLPLFIFDACILEDLQNKEDQRVSFIYETLAVLQTHLGEPGSSLLVMHGEPLQCFRQLLGQYAIGAVYANGDYEPYATARDTAIGNLLRASGIEFHTFKDHVIFEKDEVVKDNGEPYTIFTPYSRKWKQRLTASGLGNYPSEKFFHNLHRSPALSLPSLGDIGFTHTPVRVTPPTTNDAIMTNYHSTRDFPALEGTTRLSVHLRFGTVSIRDIAARALELNEVLLNELIWRDFYQAVLWHFPHVVSQSFKKEYDNIAWRNDPAEFDRWCAGETGYPIVDAGMRQLSQTGYMHNRVRMIVASFLCKHLLIDWRWGEAWFARLLLDFDLAANNGGWQWAAGCGCDAAPYFRIFNPALQTARYDPNMAYVRRWIPEFESPGYPRPIVDHAMARQRCIATFKKALIKGG